VGHKEKLPESASEAAVRSGKRNGAKQPGAPATPVKKAWIECGQDVEEIMRGVNKKLSRRSE